MTTAAPAWLESLLVAVGEDALRAAVLKAIEAGDLGEHEGHRVVLRGIVRRPGLRVAPRSAKR